MHPHRRFAATLSLVLATVLLAPPAARGAASARWQGLPLWGGPVQVAAAPRSPEIAYAATATAGVYRSLDGGRSWRFSSRGPQGRHVEILGVDPHDPRRLFAAGADGTGLYRSNDEGRLWKRVDPGFGSPFVFDVDFDPATPGRVYVATGAGAFRSGLYRSEDFGATWAALAFPDSGLAAVAVSPAAPRVVLASVFAPDGGAIFRSIDFGRTFVPVYEGRAEGFVFDPSRPRRVYAWGVTPESVLRSDDGGATWAELPVPFFARTLTVSRSGLLLAGTERGGRRSLDGGTSWENPDDAARLPRPKDRIDSFAVLADAVLAGGRRGVWRGAPDGLAWKAASDGVRGQEIGALAVAADEEATVWVSATGGFFQSRDGGATFRVRPAQVALLAVHPLAPLTAYAFGCCAPGVEEFGLMKTEDGGASWRLLPYTGVLRDVFVLTVDPLDPDIVYAGGDLEPHASACTAVRSLDGGETWRCFAPPRPHLYEPFYELSIDPRHPRTLYAGFGSGLYRSDDRGESWSRLPALGLPGDTAPLGVDPFVRGRLYAGGSAGVYRSDDGGRSFQRKSRGLPVGGSIRDFLADAARPGRLYLAVVTSPAAAGGGVYRSDDAGEHWVEISAGLPDDVAVVRLAADPRGADVIYAGTSGKSLYRLSVAD